MLAVQSNSYKFTSAFKGLHHPLQSKEMYKLQVVQGLVYGVYWIMSTNV